MKKCHKYKFPPVAFRGKQSVKTPDKPFDVILISGDAYVDHPSFPAAVVCRLLENQGLTVAVISQPDWKKDEDFTVWGKPNLFFAVTSGAMDSMVANYTATKMPRSKDRMSPAGKAGLRPKRAIQVYTQRLKQLFKKTPIVIGGVEASLRRFSHYDFWEEKVRDPILMTAPADILSYGMAETSLPAIVDWFKSDKSGTPQIPQTCIKVKHGSWKDWLDKEYQILPSVETCKADKKAFMELTKITDNSFNPMAPVFIQEHLKGDLLFFPPSAEELEKEMTILEQLQFSRSQHPVYDEPVPALEPVQFSIQCHRGCLGTCSFCALALHQGRIIRSRKVDNILKEAASFLDHKDFKGIIPDVGGPAINMFGWTCKIGGCKARNCIYPDICKNLNYSLKPLTKLLEKIRSIKGVRKVFLGSGLRFDLLKQSDWAFFEELLRHHISGQLKVAPEHVDRKILALMRKGEKANFEEFVEKFNLSCKSIGKKLFLVPYFILAFPGTKNEDALIKSFVDKYGLAHQQVQEFTPTPASLATAMYYTEHDFNFKPLTVKKNRAQRLQSRKILHQPRRNKGRKSNGPRKR